ncbi:hypothetical protein [Stieleria maiorica]|nr:hypothetical protein [Stieleria maiorica]
MACVTSGTSDDESDDAVALTVQCLRNGIASHEYVNVLVSLQRMFDDHYENSKGLA